MDTAKFTLSLILWCIGGISWLWYLELIHVPYNEKWNYKKIVLSLLLMAFCFYTGYKLIS
jgi:hypothetical protein